MPRCHLYQATQTNWMIMLIYILPPSAGPPGAPRSLEREIEHNKHTHNLQTAKCARQYITKTCHALKASWMLSRPAPFNFSPILGNFFFLSPGFFFFKINTLEIPPSRWRKSNLFQRSTYTFMTSLSILSTLRGELLCPRSHRNTQ